MPISEDERLAIEAVVRKDTDRKITSMFKESHSKVIVFAGSMRFVVKRTWAGWKIGEWCMVTW
jgi:hypothetical protein